MIRPPFTPECTGDVDPPLQRHRSTGAKKQHEEPEVWTTSGGGGKLFKVHKGVS